MIRRGFAPIPLGEAITRYLDFSEATGRKVRSSYPYLGRFWLPALGDGPLDEITTEQIEDALNAGHRAHGWSPATRNTVLNQLSGLFTFSVRRRWVAEHPVRLRIPRLPTDNARIRWLRPAEVRKVLELCPLWLRDIVTFAVKTGMRLGEVTELRVGDCQVDAHGRAYVSTGVTKNGSRLVWPLEGKLRLVVEERVYNAASPEDRLFPGPAGGCARESIDRCFKAAVIAAGFEWGRTRTGITFHTLRHSMASIAINSGVRAEVVQRMGNWKTPEMVARYAHLADETLRDAAARLDELI